MRTGPDYSEPRAKREAREAKERARREQRDRDIVEKYRIGGPEHLRSVRERPMRLALERLQAEHAERIRLAKVDGVRWLRIWLRRWADWRVERRMLKSWPRL